MSKIDEAVQLLERADTYCRRLNAVSICGKISCRNGDVYEIKNRIKQALALLKEPCKPEPFDVEAAIKIIKKSLDTHKNWLTYFEKNPDALLLEENKNVGDVEDHKKYVEEYNQVIKCLEQLQANFGRYKRALEVIGEGIECSNSMKVVIRRGNYELAQQIIDGKEKPCPHCGKSTPIDKEYCRYCFLLIRQIKKTQ